MVEWSDGVRTGKISQTLVWKALNHAIVKLVEHPPVAMCFTKEQCASMMAPVLKEALQRVGVQRNMPGVPVHDPNAAQGMGLGDIGIAQFMEHLDELMMHGVRETLTGKMMGACIGCLKLATGTFAPIWELKTELWIS